MTPVVGIIMGSDSDLPVMKKAAEMLDQLKVPYELTIVSAHRTPDRLTDYAKSAAGKGLKVIIAGAGGSAHLPGMVAAQTVLPVIGVPVQTKALGGVDSLYSIVQMPSGNPGGNGGDQRWRSMPAFWRPRSWRLPMQALASRVEAYSLKS